jgi:hypothetical protein
MVKDEFKLMIGFDFGPKLEFKFFVFYVFVFFISLFLQAFLSYS